MILTEEGQRETATEVKYPSIPEATDGSAAVVAMETGAAETIGADPATPSRRSSNPTDGESSRDQDNARRHDGIF